MIVRELVHIIGFRVNESQFGYAQNRIRQLGSLMSFVVTFPIALIGKSFVEASYNMDQLALSMEVYSKNATEAAQVTKELKDLAVALPTVQIKDLNDTVGALLARGTPASELVETFRTFAVITGATGGNMQGLTKAYTDTMNMGRLMGQEIRQFVNANVPLFQALAEYYKKPIEEVVKMTKKGGLISAQDVKNALHLMAAEGGKFATQMAKRADLLWGRWQKFLDQLYYLRAELGKKLEVPLKVILNILSDTVNVLRKLDGDWKRFIIIGLGVAAIVGPLMLMWGIISKMMGPIGYITAAIGIISLLVDDIYVWIAGGKSIMGALFGDYEKYKPQVEQFKILIIGTFDNLKSILRETYIMMLDIFTLFTDKKEYTALTALLDLLTGLAAVIYDITAALRVFGAIFGSLFMSDENFKKFKKDMVEDISKSGTLFGNITKAGMKAGEFKAGLLDKFHSFIRRNVPGMEIDQLRSDIAKHGLAPALFGGGGTPFTSGFATDQFGNPVRNGDVYGAGNVNVNIYANPTIGPNTKFVGEIQKAVEDSLNNVARNIKTNMAGNE